MDEKSTGWKRPRRVNADWQYKFELFDAIGADELPLPAALRTAEYRKMSVKDKRLINFNLCALLTGPIYYLAKRMFHKAGLLTGAGLVLALIFQGVEVVAAINVNWAFYWLPIAVISSWFASHDFYRLLISGETMWPFLPALFDTPLGALAATGIPLSFLSVAIIIFR